VTLVLKIIAAFAVAFTCITSAMAQVAVTPVNVTTISSGRGLVVSDPSWDECVTPCVLQVLTGMNVTLRVRPHYDSSFHGWHSPCTGLGGCPIDSTSASAVSVIMLEGRRNGMTVTPSSFDAGAHSIGMSSAPMPFTIRNDNPTSVFVRSLDPRDSRFRATHDCAFRNLAPGESCGGSLRFDAFAPLPVHESVQSQLVIATDNAPHDPIFYVDLSGTTEPSLVTHFYRSILGREPDPGAREYWESEVARVKALGADSAPVWQALGAQLFASDEYHARGSTAEQTLEHLYYTYLVRAPDAAGFAFYMDLFNAGMVPLGWTPAFSMSQEFTYRTTVIFGSTPPGPVGALIMDFYRGALRRLPDTAGYQYWHARFRQAACEGPSAVHTAADEITQAFFTSPEHMGPQWNPFRYIAHLYDTFLRRTPDMAGVQYWTSRVMQSATLEAREVMRREFLASPEFQQRIGHVIELGCS
jgi:hypothetical protein